MNRTAIIVFLQLCVLIAIGPHVGPAATAPPAVIRNTVVLVAKRNARDMRYVPVGTAFHVGGGWFRTAAHVVRWKLPKRYEGRGFDEWALYQPDEFGNPRRYLGTFDITCVDRRWVHDEDAVFPHDSALIRISDGTVPEDTLQVSRSPLRVGDGVSVWGFPNGSVLFESKARVAGISNRWIQVQEAVGTPVIRGHSGSPVVNRGGEVVGIMSAGVEGVGQHGMAVPMPDAESGCPKP